uniref:Uncharacterized protein n=1 Tax=Anguilla anguilla TaxID=7936 RepID=A0A0E9R3H8_ANGAN
MQPRINCHLNGSLLRSQRLPEPRAGFFRCGVCGFPCKVELKLMCKLANRCFGLCSWAVVESQWSVVA